MLILEQLQSKEGHLPNASDYGDINSISERLPPVPGQLGITIDDMVSFKERKQIHNVVIFRLFKKRSSN